MIICKSPSELERMKAANQVVAEVLQALREAVRPGVTTGELDALAEARIRAAGAEPAFKGYHGFPASLCASVNEEVIHGIPSQRELMEGDIVSLDMADPRSIQNALEFVQQLDVAGVRPAPGRDGERLQGERRHRGLRPVRVPGHLDRQERLQRHPEADPVPAAGPEAGGRGGQRQLEQAAVEQRVPVADADPAPAKSAGADGSSGNCDQPRAAQGGGESPPAWPIRAGLARARYDSRPHRIAGF